jgi:hypothetical protein
VQARFLALIHAYQRAVADAVGIFCERADVAQPADWRAAGRVRTGQLAGRPVLHYVFHGTGLELRLGSHVVDVEFGHDGRFDGFDEWRLWRFALEGTPDFPEFRARAEVARCFLLSRASGQLAQRFRAHQDDLYYLVAEAAAAT